MSRVIARIVTVVALLTAGLVAPTTGAAPTDAAAAADLSRFNPGNIISDAVFYDYRSMNASEVQAFLNTEGAECTAGDLCLKNYRVDTTDRAADALCGGYRGAAGESAATIITKVALSCRVSPRVLLVLLEKEMSLVGGTSPTSRKYDRAAGYSCPDNVGGWCDPAYAGLQNQLYWSAWQYRKYQAHPMSYAHVAGRDNKVRWHPDANCGSSSVYIVNQATAGLYNYTPYQPNRAALAAGYGASSDPCASYGNRNFFSLFTDWFGSTQSTGGSAIVARGDLADAATIGKATSGIICGLRDRGCFRAHETGAIYWSPATGARLMWGGIHERWAALGWERSRLGYPTTEQACGLPGGGCFQEYQAGAIYWSPASGAQPVLGAIRTKWNSTGWEAGPLGYPTSAEWCGLSDRGCVQKFQHGNIYWSSASGAHAMVPGVAFDLWRARGADKGTLGYPTGDLTCGLADDGCTQSFEEGAIYTSASLPARVVVGAVATKYAAAKAHAGALGFPTSSTVCGLRDNGCAQEFERGAVYSSAGGGARMVLDGAIRRTWAAYRLEAGPLGYPATDQRCQHWGCSQQFTGGAVYLTKAGTKVVWGAIYAAWTRERQERGPLGLPVRGEICGLVKSGCFQEFQRGSVYWSPATGAHRVSGKILAAWGAQGWERGKLGYPTSAPVASSKGITQRFQGGTLLQASGTGQVIRK